MTTKQVEWLYVAAIAAIALGMIVVTAASHEPAITYREPNGGAMAGPDGKVWCVYAGQKICECVPGTVIEGVRP